MLYFFEDKIQQCFNSMKASILLSYPVTELKITRRMAIANGTCVIAISLRHISIRLQGKIITAEKLN